MCKGKSKACLLLSVIRGHCGKKRQTNRFQTVARITKWFWLLLRPAVSAAEQRIDLNLLTPVTVFPVFSTRVPREQQIPNLLSCFCFCFYLLLCVLCLLCCYWCYWWYYWYKMYKNCSRLLRVLHFLFWLMLRCDPTLSSDRKRMRISQTPFQVSLSTFGTRCLAINAIITKRVSWYKTEVQ